MIDPDKEIRKLPSMMDGSREHYKYYDTPDGHNCFEKLYYLTSRIGLAGLMFGIGDAMMRTRTKGFWPSLNCCAYWTFPPMAMAATFASTTCILTNIRGKDTVLNPFLGAVAATAILSAWRRGHSTNTALGFFIVGSAVVKWIGHDRDYVFFPAMRRLEIITEHQWDTSSAPDFPPEAWLENE